MYAEILFPQKVGLNKDILTYKIPENFKVSLGQIVEVPLRKKKIKGIIFNISKNEPAYATKEIVKIVENAPHLQKYQIEILKWISDYYFCPLFKSLKLFLPTSFIKRKKIITDALIQISPYEFQTKHELSENQKSVLEKIAKTQKQVILLHGITGSGKTEIYLHAADVALKKDQQVLILIPEISLTPQTVEKFKTHFKQEIAVIHSQLTNKQKEQEWLRIHKNQAKIIIGSRSAIFAPFCKLGIIIIDEEHDSCYKQDNLPRYNTLDVAKKIAELLKIKILIGSATPSLESYYQAKNGLYELVELADRIKKQSFLPKTEIIDMRSEIKKKNFSIFSEKLQEKLDEKLNKKDQSLLFLNRRGAASGVICRECGYIAKCSNCDIAMTYHKKFSVENLTFNTERLICHHCGKTEKVPSICPNCKSVYIRYIGLGTQRVEDEVNKLLPLARVIRADRDTVSKKDDFKKIYETFKKGEADVLIGTQMVAIGLHLPKINLVGIILADLSLMIPSFRSAERTFQLLTQVSGRAGREMKGEVIIQTYLPNNYVIQKAALHDYKGFYETEIKFRKEMNYPPFTKLIKLTVTNKDHKQCLEKTLKVFLELENYNQDKKHTINYYPALIPRLRNLYRFHILINGPTPEKLLKSLKDLADLIIDVDPISTV